MGYQNRFFVVYNIDEVMKMALRILETERGDITRLACPRCGEKVRFVGLLRDSEVKGLTFKCKRCGKLWSVQTVK